MKNLKNMFILVIVFLLSVNQVNGCWVGFSIEELYDNADVIVIGEYKGVYKSLNKSFSTTSWEIHPEFVIKGDVQGIINIETPGSAISDLKSSIDYSLTDFGDRYFLLFLDTSGDRMQPMSPQGVFSLDKEDQGSLLETYNIRQCSYSISEQLELLNRINDGDVVVVENDLDIEAPVENDDNILLKASPIAVMVLGGGVILFNLKKRLTK